MILHQKSFYAVSVKEKRRLRMKLTAKEIKSIVFEEHEDSRVRCPNF